MSFPHYGHHPIMGTTSSSSLQHHGYAPIMDTMSMSSMVVTSPWWSPPHGGRRELHPIMGQLSTMGTTSMPPLWEPHASPHGHVPTMSISPSWASPHHGHVLTMDTYPLWATMSFPPSWALTHCGHLPCTGTMSFIPSRTPHGGQREFPSIMATSPSWASFHYGHCGHYPMVGTIIFPPSWVPPAPPPWSPPSLSPSISCPAASAFFSPGRDQHSCSASRRRRACSGTCWCTRQAAPPAAPPRRTPSSSPHAPPARPRRRLPVGEGRNRNVTQPQVPLLHKTSLICGQNFQDKKQQPQVITGKLGQENILPPSQLHEGLSACSGGCRTLLFPPITASAPRSAWETLRPKSPSQEAAASSRQTPPLAQCWGTPSPP